MIECGFEEGRWSDAISGNCVFKDVPDVINELNNKIVCFVSIKMSTVAGRGTRDFQSGHHRDDQGLPLHADANFFYLYCSKFLQHLLYKNSSTKITA